MREDKDGKRYRVLYCVKCNVDVEKDMEHCEDCDICVYGYDHHCVFFSKCIGAGNIYCFGGSIAMLILNFVIMFIFMMLDVKDKPRQNKRLPKLVNLIPQNITLVN